MIAVRAMMRFHLSSPQEVSCKQPKMKCNTIIKDSRYTWS